MNLGLYRKAIAVFITQLVGILALYAPGIAQHIGPETIQLLAFVASTVVALIVSDKVGGWKVNDLAKALLAAASDIGRDVPPTAVVVEPVAGKETTLVVTDPPPANVVPLRPGAAPDQPEA